MSMSDPSSHRASESIAVWVTVPSMDVATTLAKTLVEEKLVACVNIVPGLRSIYAWQGKICDDPELLCIMKTKRILFQALRDRVIALHPYEVPEIIALPLVDGSPAYLAWVASETREG